MVSVCTVPAREGGACEHFVGYKTINRIPLHITLLKHYFLLYCRHLFKSSCWYYQMDPGIPRVAKHCYTGMPRGIFYTSYWHASGRPAQELNFFTVPLGMDIIMFDNSKISLERPW